MAGKSIICSACGARVQVPAASTAPGGKAAAKRKVDNTPSVTVSPALIIGVVIVVLVIGTVLALYLGPWTVGKQWEAMSDKANDQVTDVVDFALRAYESQSGSYDAAQSHMVPMHEGKASFIPPAMAFSLPKKMVFSGKTNQGNYMGTYDTSTGEINADIETGGWTIGGLVDARKATGKFHIAGREKNGETTAECDGEPLKIVMRKPPGKGD